MRRINVRTLGVTAGTRAAEAALALAALVGLITGADTAHASQARLTHAEATARLRAADVEWSSSKGCSDKNGNGCTSFDGILAATLDLAIDLKKRSHCEVMITGAAEVHPHRTTGTRTHGNGYKIDVRPNSCVGAFVTDHFHRAGTRGEAKDPKWTAGSAEYVLEKHGKKGEHWDITYTG
ncbi:hypothetical protein [Kitasatospora sp. NPDC059673]|uniref:hypothetical protein n=1 Tax=Kitasatospora sp. NPDC059673 TaxID=3346901 RepID=UPI003676371F